MVRERMTIASLANLLVIQTIRKKEAKKREKADIYIYESSSSLRILFFLNVF